LKHLTVFRLICTKCNKLCVNT